MPELPEVETIVRGLAGSLPGRRLERAEVLHANLIEGESPAAFARGVEGLRVQGVERRAKNIVIGLGEARLVVNLGMTGRLLHLPSSDPGPERHVGVRFALDDGSWLVYHDVRRFGRLRRWVAAAWEERSDALGVEPLEPAFDGAWLHRATRGSRAPIKSWLMDQKKVVGVGNIYAQEALHRAGVHPTRAAGSLSRQRAARLADSVREVLTEAVEFRGTTLMDYRDASGGEGGFAARLRVYGRGGEPCRTCGARLRRIVQAGRSTVYCPRCQR
jgi:formamidopyrimidine-DNA glycosylase